MIAIALYCSAENKVLRTFEGRRYTPLDAKRVII